MQAVCFYYPRPNMLDLSADDCVHRVLVAIPVLAAPVDHSTVWTFNHVTKHMEKEKYKYV